MIKQIFCFVVVLHIYKGIEFSQKTIIYLFAHNSKERYYNISRWIILTKLPNYYSIEAKIRVMIFTYIYEI